MNDIKTHYDYLIDTGNDPVFDPPVMQKYMDKWDGLHFFDLLKLTKNDDVLEIGVGTGRLALKTAPKCRKFVGIDISPKTAERAKSNLKELDNAEIICGDFLEFDFECKFDLVYSSLTFMHIKNKNSAVKKIAELLNIGGRAVISLDKNQEKIIDLGEIKTTVYPDNPENIKELFIENGFENVNVTETEFAFIVRGKI